MKKEITTLALIVGLTISIQARTFEEAVAVCEEGNAQMCIGIGKDLKKRNKPEEAQKYFSKGLKALETKCEENNPDACFSLAQFHARGDVLKENKQEAKKLFDKSSAIFKKACEKEDENSCMKVEQVNMHLEML